MPRYEQPEVFSEVYDFLAEARKRQDRERVHEAWDRVIPSGETVHRLVVEPLAHVLGGLEKVAKTHKVAAVIGAGALSATVGFMSSTMLKR